MKNPRKHAVTVSHPHRLIRDRFTSWQYVTRLFYNPEIARDFAELVNRRIEQEHGNAWPVNFILDSKQVERITDINW
jgi:hypothetical protein